MKMTYFKVYSDFIDVARELDNGARGRLFMALLQYVNGEEVDALSGVERIAYVSMRSQIDREAATYAELSSARSAAGAKGARKRWGEKDDSPRNGGDMANMANAILPYGKNSKHGNDGYIKDKEKDKDKDVDAHARAMASAPSPLLADDEMDGAAEAYAQDRQAVLAAMERVGMQPTAYNAETALALAAAHGADGVVAALEKAAQHDRKGGISWAFVKAILENPQQPPKPKTRKVRETLYIGGERVETVREVPYDQPVR